MFNEDRQNLQFQSNNAYCRVPRIYAMPERFLSAAAQNIKLKKEKKKDKRGIGGVKTPIHKPAKKRLIHPAILILVIIIIIGLSASVIYLLTQKNKSPVVVVNSNFNTNKRPSNINTTTPKHINKNINRPPASKCGDGNIDTGIGEECDDKNTKSGDGCSSRCKVEKPPKLPIVTFTSYAISVDSDDDFLTDMEEKLYGTGVNKMDEDNDSYLDGLELINLYNPKEKNQAKLEDSDMINILNNQEQGYSIFYPNGWSVRYLNEDKSAVNFISNTVEFVQVLVIDNPSKKSIMNWIKKEFPDIDIDKLERVGVGDKLGVRSPDGLTVYFANEDKIYSVTYQISTLRRLNFKATFQMIYNSLKLYSRHGATETSVDRWKSYVNNRLGIKLQHPVNLETTISENNIIKIDDFNLQLLINDKGVELNEWFWNTYTTEDNAGCEIRTSELKIGKLKTFLVDKPIDNENKKNQCNDGGYYAVSKDKKRIIKLIIGNNPVREMAQILSTVELFHPKSAIE